MVATSFKEMMIKEVRGSRRSASVGDIPAELQLIQSCKLYGSEKVPDIEAVEPFIAFMPL